jgi:hypothetical protein
VVEKLLTKLRGKDYRAAYRAIPQLCRLNDGSLAAVVASYKPKDDQRRFQFEVARIALAEGIRGLTARWLSLGTEEQRRVLLQEIGPEWGDEWMVEIAIAALEEPDDKVRGYAVLLAKGAAQRGAGISPAQRARITQGLVRAMARHNERPLELFWLPWYVELLGLTADASDELVVARLERLRPFSGASRRTVFEKLDPDNLPWPHNVLAEKKGVRVVATVSYLGTGLLEIELLETSLRQIRARKPQGKLEKR